MNTLSKLTRKQQEILGLLYTFRFLNRIQIQAMMHHKDYKTINMWLKDLRKNGYVEWIYSTHFAEKTKPAVYYLALNGIRHIREQYSHPIEELRKRYRESTRSLTYIDHCILIANCCLALEQARDKSDPAIHTWNFYETEAVFIEESYYHFLLKSESIRPNLCFSMEVYEGMNEPVSEKSYLLEIFDATLPRYRVKKRLTDYITYLDDEGGIWKEETDTTTLPIILLVCPRISDLIYAKRRTRGLLSDIWDKDEERPHVRFTTIEQLRVSGVLGNIWEEA